MRIRSYRAFVVVALAAACSATGDRSFEPTGTGGGSSGGQGGDLGLVPEGQEGVLDKEPPCSGIDPQVDHDGDGWTGAAGDCNDCTEQMNPGALDYAGNHIDEDCNGAADDTEAACDGALAVDSQDAMDGARALGLCKLRQAARWGVISAKYTAADGTPLPEPLGHGILPRFGAGVGPQEGARILALSSGAARTPDDAGYFTPAGFDKGYATGAPAGYPKESPSCEGTLSGQPHDSAALAVTIQTPTNAKSLRFNLDFYTYEFPRYICSTYNDFFVAMLSPTPEGQVDGNVSFDSLGNTISVNAGFLDVCHAQEAGGKSFPCSLGASQLAGTGFDDKTNSAATGWLVTKAPVEDPGGTITLLFAIWDSGDGALDSTVLLDNFAFDPVPAQAATSPVPVPK